MAARAATGAYTRFRAIATIVGAIMLTAALPQSAWACTTQQRAQLSEAQAIASRLTQGGKPGAADVRGIAQRARTRCAAAGYARAVARITARDGEARPGRRYQMYGYLLYGTREGTRNVYRLDVERHVMRWRSARRATAASRELQLLTTLGVPRPRGMYWSNDPTRLVFDTQLQVSTALRLSASKDPAARTLASRTLNVYAAPARSRSITQAPLLSALGMLVTVDVVAARTSTPGNRTVAARLAVPVEARVRRASSGGWSRVDGEWATHAQQRRLSRLAKQHARHRPAFRTVAQRISNQLTMLPTVSFRQLPAEAFYPWPRDGVRDAQTATMHVDKPSSAVVTIYGIGGIAVRSLRSELLPGDFVVTWDGTDNDGKTLPAGSYRYGLRVTDRAGNRRVLPGLGSFTIARDTTAPRIDYHLVRHLSGKPNRRIRVRWRAHEPLSPRMRIHLVVRGNGVHRIIPLKSRGTTGTETVVTKLPAGRYSTRVRIVDGSGNKAVVGSNRLVLR